MLSAAPSQPHNEPHVVIIGGGPIGLAHALGIKKLNPAVKVTVYEKYSEYQRKHTLIMEPKQLEAYITATEAKADETLGNLLRQLKKDKHIRTNDLEARFKELAIAHDVTIVQQDVDEEGIDGILALRPSLIIGADGTHSTVDRCLFAPNTYLVRLNNDDPALREQQLQTKMTEFKQTEPAAIFYIRNAQDNALTYVYFENGKIKQTEEKITIKANTPFPGCRLWLMPEEKHTQNSNTTNLHLYKQNKQLVYYIDGKPHFFEDGTLNQTIGALFTSQSNQALALNRLSENQKQACEQLLAETSKRGHTAFTIPDLIRLLNTEKSTLQPLTPAQTKIITTHTTLTPKGNQIKHEFDYVLQLRYEIKGKDKAKAIHLGNFYQDMARQGLIANEYVGSYDAEKKSTPITMQMMISKADFELLKKQATSKNPIEPFKNKPLHINSPQLSKELRKFIYSYLARKVQSCYKNNDLIDRDSVRISVNEAPATEAEQVFRIHPQYGIPVILVGDAGLGLSYFKGLNAGLNAAAKLLTTLSAAIKNGFQGELVEPLKQYQHFFTKFAEEKVKEVKNYSKFRIRSFMRIIEAVRAIKDSSYMEPTDDPSCLIADYLDLQETAYRLSNDSSLKKEWQFYPHRNYGLVKFGQFEYVPLQHTLLKMAKQFKDYFKPYKSNHQIKQDVSQPLSGIAYLGVGVTKMIVGFFAALFTWHRKSILYFADGLFTVARGALELTATLLTWFIKMPIRGVITAIYGRPNIEENAGMKKLVNTGKTYLKNCKQADDGFDTLQKHQLMAICNDMHRKFTKSLERGQNSQIEEMKEYQEYSAIRANTRCHLIFLEEIDPSKMTLERNTVYLKLEAEQVIYFSDRMTQLGSINIKDLNATISTDEELMAFKDDILTILSARNHTPKDYLNKKQLLHYFSLFNNRPKLETDAPIIRKRQKNTVPPSPAPISV